jgi:glycosyltransferase involved in cell wall biosynthesis
MTSVSSSRVDDLRNEVPEDVPNVAIIIPCLNAEKWIARAIQSALDQGYPKLEVIVVDDGSTDRSLEIIRSFGNRIILETGVHRGGCAARNVGLSVARATFVLFLDADDYLEGPALVGAILNSARTDADVIFLPIAFEYENGARDVFQYFDGTQSPVDVFAGWPLGRWVAPCAVIWRRDFVIRAGGWNERVLRNQDGELILRAMLCDPIVGASPYGLGIYNLHNDPSVSKRCHAASVRSELAALEPLLLAAKHTKFESAAAGYATHLYSIAKALYIAGDDKAGDHALQLARSFGITGQGSKTHRFFIAILGLKAKTKLALLIRPRSPAASS